MKTATYRTLDGSPLVVEYDENAPCRVCGEPVNDASMGGIDVCPSCDCGRCRYCGVSCGMLLKAELDGGRSLQRWRDHMTWHREHPTKPAQAIAKQSERV